MTPEGYMMSVLYETHTEAKTLGKLLKSLIFPGQTSRGTTTIKQKLLTGDKGAEDQVYVTIS